MGVLARPNHGPAQQRTPMYILTHTAPLGRSVEIEAVSDSVALEAVGTLAARRWPVRR